MPIVLACFRIRINHCKKDKRDRERERERERCRERGRERERERGREGGKAGVTLRRGGKGSAGWRGG
jgi:hypothetical protein